MEESVPSIPPSIWTSINSCFTPIILFIFLNLTIATILFTSNLPNNNHKKQQDQNQEQPPNQTVHIQSKLPRSQSILNRLKSINLYPQISQPQPQRQEAFEIAATQYVFNHPFPHEQDLQPLSTQSDSFDLNPTHTNETTFQNDQTDNLDLDPTRLDHTNEVPFANVQTHFVYDKHTVEKVITHYDFGPTRDENENPDTNDEGNDVLRSLDDVYSSITGGHVNRTKSDTFPASGEIPVKLQSKMKKSASLKSEFSHFEEDKIIKARRPATVRERRSEARETEDDDVEVDAKADDFINKFKHQLKLQRLDSIIRYKGRVNRGSEK